MLDIRIGAAQRHDTLTVFPLVTPGELELPYVPLARALEEDRITITEVGEGTVPELQASVTSGAAVLILDGEQLIGARQNRMVNRSILLPGDSKVRIPVSCMEQGRWRHVTPTFSPGAQHCPAGVRRRARDQEAVYANTGAPAPLAALAGAQGTVWSAIREQARALGAHSDTMALNEYSDQRGEDVASRVRRFPFGDEQVGILAFLNGAPLGMDVIGGRALYAAYHERLLRGYVLDALGAKPEGAEVAAADAQAFLDAVRGAERVSSPTIGVGAYAALAGAVVGGELEHEGRAVHLSAFPEREAAEGADGPAAHDERVEPRLSSRRRRYRR